MRKPKYRKHSSRNFGFVEIEGVRHRLPGEYGSAESVAAYEALVFSLSKKPTVQVEATVEDIVANYLVYAERTYKSKWNKGEARCSVGNFRVLLEMCRHERAADFGPRAFKEYASRLIQLGLARSTINLALNRVRRAFRIAASDELVPASVWDALRSVPNLRPGRTAAKEPPPRSPVSWSVVEATVAHLHPMLRDMVLAQWWIGCRSESLCLARPEQFTTSGPVWTWRPRHKVEWKKDLVLAIGPRAQEHLRPYIGNRPFLFQPRLAINSCRAGDHYSPQSYCVSVKRGAKKAGVPKWTPHQLRHARATMLREKFGLEAARVSIGHESVDQTTLYAEANLQAAIRIAAETG